MLSAVAGNVCHKLRASGVGASGFSMSEAP